MRVYGTAGAGVDFLSAGIPTNPHLISHETPNTTTQIVSSARNTRHDSGGSRQHLMEAITQPYGETPED